MYSRERLTEDFRSLGVRAGDVIMLHASIRAVGEMAGGPDQIHLALKDALAPGGTLFMYASCPQYTDEVGRGNLTASEEAEVLEKLPTFDPRTARSARDNGALVECLRTWPDTVVNDHVVRFAAWGSAVPRLFATQPWNFALGQDSPLERFLELDGKVLLLGCDHDAVTFLHYVEHVADFPDKRIARFKVPVSEGGVRIWREMAEVDSSDGGAHGNWPPRFFATIVDGFLEATGNRGGLVGDARSHLLPVRALYDYARPVMERVASRQI